MRKLTLLFLLIASFTYGQTGKTTLQETERNRTAITGAEYFRIATPGANWKLDIDSLRDYFNDSTSGGSTTPTGPVGSIQFRGSSNNFRGSQMVTIDTVDGNKGLRYYNPYQSAGFYFGSQTINEAGLYFDNNDAEIITATEDEVHLAQNNIIIDALNSVTNIKTDSLILDSLAGSGTRMVKASATGKLSASLLDSNNVVSTAAGVVSKVTLSDSIVTYKNGLRTATSFDKAKVRGYKIFAAMILQDASSTMVFDGGVLINELGGTPSISSIGTGYYQIEITGAFTADKTSNYTCYVSGDANSLVVYGKRSSTSTYDIFISRNDALEDDRLIDPILLEIRVYY